MNEKIFEGTFWRIRGISHQFPLPHLASTAIGGSCCHPQMGNGFRKSDKVRDIEPKWKAVPKKDQPEEEAILKYYECTMSKLI
jgi:hypothetical protein